MRTTSFALLATLGLAATASAAKVDPHAVKKASNPNAVTRFMVELDDPSKLSGRFGGRRSVHKELYANLDKRVKKWQLVKEFDHPELFTGASIKINAIGDYLDTLGSIPGVKAIYPIKTYRRPIPAKAITGKGVPDTQSTHIQTGIDKLHAEGILGKGIRIGIIDTGTDYTHPFLGGAFGPGHKVAYGYDLVGDNYDGSNEAVPDPDPFDDCDGHGTHVAGIIGANPGNPYNISGAAYQATLGSYKVFGCVAQPSVGDDVIIDALIAAYKDNSDIITLSLGGAAGWTESVSSVVASRIADKGKILTIAAGNDGAYGGWYTSSPATGKDVIAVASVENSNLSIRNATVSNHAPVPYNSLQPLPGPDPKPVYVTSTDVTKPDDACDPLPDSTPDLSGYVVVVRRGTCAFVQKLGNIAAKGGKVSLIYDNLVEALISPSVGNYTASFISAADGESIVKMVASGQKVTIAFPQGPESLYSFQSPDAGLVSSFSTYGPSNDMFFKPAVAAIGGNVISTYPQKLGSYALLSGTSMATPQLAGISALYLQVKGKSAAIAQGARSVFQTTASYIPEDNSGKSPFETLSQAGAGLVNAYSAVHYSTIVTPGELLLNDTAHFRGIQTIRVQNNGKKLQTYKLSHIAAGTAPTYDSGSVLPLDGPLALTTAAASVRIFPSSLVVAPGGSATAVVTISPPKLDASTYPVYSGFIQVQGSLGETLHSSYLGVASSLKDMHILDTTDYYLGVPLPTVLDANGDVQANGTTYTFQGGDYPTLFYRFAAGTPAFFVDLVPANTNFKPTYTKRDENRLFERDFWFPWWSSRGSGSFAKVATVGPLYSADYQSRNSDGDAASNGYNTFDWMGTFTNGTAVKKGSYKLLVRALKITGDKTKEEDYESWLSSVINVA